MHKIKSTWNPNLQGNTWMNLFNQHMMITLYNSCMHIICDTLFEQKKKDILFKMHWNGKDELFSHIATSSNILWHQLVARKNGRH
jgi:hypothetical protein